MTIRHLLDNFIPTQYDIHLTIEGDEQTFAGLIHITGTPRQNGELRLHAKDLKIDYVQLGSNDDNTTFSYGDNDELIIQSTAIKAEQDLGLSIKYTGQIQDSMHGFYKSHWTLDDVEHTLLATQFESIHARKAFPCVDEPAAKATFSLTLKTRSNLTVLSNTPILSQTTEHDLTTTHFEQTPKMSTYLLAWAIGELHYKSAKTKRGIDVSVYSTLAQPLGSLDFALDTAVRAIDFYEDFYQTDYPLPKSDHLALPDFSSGAMENWGLITYRESALLADPKTSNIDDRERIATVVAHELAHQWFGNLVTMKWWDDLWLNESFANMMEYLCIDNLEPTWQMWREFNAQEGSYSMRRDAIDGVQAVHVDIDHPDEIDAIFDGAIVYAKGGRLLRMLQTFIGEEAFRKGLKIYFDKYTYSNTSADDLWLALAAASNLDIKKFMDQWLYKPGYPIVSVNLDGAKLKLTQERFFTSSHGADASLWPIPLDANIPELPKLFDAKESTVNLKNPNELIILNQHDYAHFITHYDDQLLARILDAVQTNQLTVEARLAFLRNTLMLNRADVIISDKLIDILLAYKDETSELGWSLMANILGELRKFNQPDSVEDNKLDQFVIQLASKEFARLGWDAKKGEPLEDTKLRSIIVSLMLSANEPGAIKKANQIFASGKLVDINSELRASILGSAVKNSDDKTFDSLFDTYIKTNNPSLREDLNGALTNTKSTIKVAEMLEKLKNPKIIRPQDAQYWWVYMLSNRRHRQAVWQWLQDNWSWAEKTYKGDMSYDSFPRYAGNILNTADQLREYSAFFEPMKADPSLARTIQLGELDIKARVKQIKKDIVAVHQRLKSL